MKDKVLSTIEQHFGDLTDPRGDQTKLHGFAEYFGDCHVGRD